MTKDELLAEAKLIDQCELPDDGNDVEQLIQEACKEITKLEVQVAYWKLSYKELVWD